MDEDIQGFTRSELKAEIIRLRNAVRKHRNEKGHDRCWVDDQTLYEVLPEIDPADFRLPDREEFLHNCELYFLHRQPNTKE